MPAKKDYGPAARRSQRLTRTVADIDTTTTTETLIRKIASEEEVVVAPPAGDRD